jgi:hypothetical protein
MIIMAYRKARAVAHHCRSTARRTSGTPQGFSGLRPVDHFSQVTSISLLCHPQQVSGRLRCLWLQSVALGSDCRLGEGC